MLVCKLLAHPCEKFAQSHVQSHKSVNLVKITGVQPVTAAACPHRARRFGTGKGGYRVGADSGNRAIDATDVNAHQIARDPTELGEGKECEKLTFAG